MTEDRVPLHGERAHGITAGCPDCRVQIDAMTEDGTPTLNAITEHIEREARRIGTYHRDPAATPGGTGYCIPAAVATQIVDKYLSAQPAPPLDAGDPVAQAKFSLHRLARTTEDAQYINRIVSGLAARLSEQPVPSLDVEAAIVAVLDGEDTEGAVMCGYQTDDPGTGSGPGFCICGEWSDTDGITWGQHVADRVAAHLGSAASTPEARDD